jgi:hypothetical protein
MPRPKEEKAWKYVLLFIAGLALFLYGSWNPFGYTVIWKLSILNLWIETVGGAMVVAAYWYLREIL